MLLKLEVAALVKLHQAKVAFQEFLTDEDGDTNFISVIIILAIICALAIVFRDNIAEIANAVFEKAGQDVGAATGTNVNTTDFK